MSDDLKSKTVRGLKWTSIDSVSQNIFQVIVGLILANLVGVEDFGTIAILQIFIVLANLFQESGFGTALIRKNDVTEKEYASVFYFSVVISVLIYLALFFSIDLIADFQQKPIPRDLARILFLTFVASSFGIVPYTILARKVDYRSIAFSNLAALILSNAVAIFLAWRGFGAWAICSQTVIYHTVRVSGLWYYSSWKPTTAFSFQPLKEMFAFSSKLMLTQILYTIANNFTPNMIDRYFNRIETGYYYTAQKWYNKPVSLFTLPIGNIGLPVMSKVNDDIERQGRVFRKLIKTMAFVAFPLSVIFAFIAPEFILIFLKEKWISVIPYMQLLCISTIFVPFDQLLFNLIYSRGKSGALFIFSLIKSILLIAGLFLSVKYGVIVLIIVSGAINYLFSALISFYSIRLVNCKIKDYLLDTAPYLFTSLALVAITHFLLFKPIDNSLVAMLLKGGIPTILYLIIMYLGKSEIMMEGVGYAQRFIHRKLK